MTWAVLSVCALAVAQTATAQPTAASLFGATLSENFDAVGTSAGSALPMGFGFGTAATTSDFATATTTTTQAAATNSMSTSASGGAYVFNISGTGDKAVGFLSSSPSFLSPRSIVYGFTNHTGQTITQLDIGFDYEKYRTGTRAYTFNFYTSATGAVGGFTQVSAGSQAFTADSLTSNSNFGSGPLATVSKSASITGLNIADGASYYLLWEYAGVGGSTNAQALAIDNFTLSATFSPVPEPATLLAVAAGGLGLLRLRRRLV